MPASTGSEEEGTIPTPFDMTVLKDLDLFHLVMDAINPVPQTGERFHTLKQRLLAKLIAHTQCIGKHGQGLPEIRNWKWDTTYE